MPAPAELRFRAARPGDAQAITALHAGSWQQHYRGAFSDAFLDHEAIGYLLPLWTERLATPNPQTRTILAEHDGTVVGLAYTLLGQDATWGRAAAKPRWRRIVYLSAAFAGVTAGLAIGLALRPAIRPVPGPTVSQVPRPTAHQVSGRIPADARVLTVTPVLPFDPGARRPVYACTGGGAACGEPGRGPNRCHLPRWPSASPPGSRSPPAGPLPNVLAV